MRNRCRIFLRSAVCDGGSPAVLAALTARHLLWAGAKSSGFCPPPNLPRGRAYCTTLFLAGGKSGGFCPPPNLPRGQEQGCPPPNLPRERGRNCNSLPARGERAGAGVKTRKNRRPLSLPRGGLGLKGVGFFSQGAETYPTNALRKSIRAPKDTTITHTPPTTTTLPTKIPAPTHPNTRQ
jgi:hypothetical protein